MTIYTIPQDMLGAFQRDGRPYWSFDTFNNVVQHFRDTCFAVEHIDGFIEDIGRDYNLWTANTANTYRRHLFWQELNEPVSVSFRIPHSTRRATFPLEISIFGPNGVFFDQTQTIAVEKRQGSRWALTSWKRVPPVRDFVVAQTGSAAN